MIKKRKVDKDVLQSRKKEESRNKMIMDGILKNKNNNIKKSSPIKEMNIDLKRMNKNANKANNNSNSNLKNEKTKSKISKTNNYRKSY